MKVRLTKKYAEQIDGIDLGGYDVGDVLDLLPREAQLIIAEQWAVPERRLQARPTRCRRRAEDQSPDLPRAS